MPLFVLVKLMRNAPTLMHKTRKVACFKVDLPTISIGEGLYFIICTFVVASADDLAGIWGLFVSRMQELMCNVPSLAGRLYFCT